MAVRIDASSPYTHLLLIETHSVDGEITDSSYLDIETVPLNSINEVQEELRRRYSSALTEPLLGDDEKGTSPVGVVYTCKPNETDQGSLRDVVRVYAFPEQELAPLNWAMPEELADDQRLGQLTQSIRRLLASPDLNLDSLDEETHEAIAEAQSLLDS